MDTTETKKLIILNGPTRGLGRALVSEIIIEERYDLICLVRNSNDIQDLSLFQNKIRIIQCDYRNLDEVNEMDRMFSKLFIQRFNEVCFVNNLSVISPIGKIGSLQNDDIQNSIMINILSNAIMINSFLKHARADNFVSILNISSGISTKPVAGLGLYGLSKSCNQYISEVIHKENFNNNVRITSFYPGGMKTNMQTVLQNELGGNEELRSFDYSSIYNQELRDTKKIAEIIFTNFFQNDKGWNKLISKIYEYDEE